MALVAPGPEVEKIFFFSPHASLLLRSQKPFPLPLPVLHISLIKSGLHATPKTTNKKEKKSSCWDWLIKIPWGGGEPDLL